MIYSKNNGFTLVELLIALVIVAIGALGHAKMQMTSMHNAQRASFSQTANVAMNDLTQRIRALPNAALNGEFNTSIGTGPTGSKSCNDTGVVCSRSEFALFELEDWYGDVSSILPSPQFSVVQATTNGSYFTVSLLWDANKDGTLATTCSAITAGSVDDQCGEVKLWVR